VAKKKTTDLSDITGLEGFTFPEPEFYKEMMTTGKKAAEVGVESTSRKHDDAYEAYVKWAATPRSLREPKTAKEFEKIWHLPMAYTSTSFTQRSDFQEKRMRFFWNWMYDRFPDVIYAVYRRAITNSTADARIFAEIIGKKLETDAPRAKMTPFVLVGVPQEKINELFVPENYENAEVVDAEPKQ
jgi:hypothetical protein